MEIDLYYFDKETLQISNKLCIYCLSSSSSSSSNTDNVVEMKSSIFDFDLDKVMIEMLEEIYKNMNIFSSEIFTNCRGENTLYFKNRETCELFIPFLQSKQKILLPRDIVEKINVSLDDLSSKLDIIETGIGNLNTIEEKILVNTRRYRRSSSLSKYMNYESYSILEKYIKLVELKRLIGLVTCDFYEDLTDKINKLFKIKLDIIIGGSTNDFILQNIVSILSKDANDLFCNINYSGNLKEYYIDKTEVTYLERVISIIMEESKLIEILE